MRLSSAHFPLAKETRTEHLEVVVTHLVVRHLAGRAGQLVMGANTTQGRGESEMRKGFG